MKTVLATLAVITLAGCGSLNQVVSAYGAAAVESAKGANDNLIAGWTTTACATPISAALRNPHIIQALRALCLPATEVSPSFLLDQMESQQIRQVSP